MDRNRLGGLVSEDLYPCLDSCFLFLLFVCLESCFLTALFSKVSQQPIQAPRIIPGSTNQQEGRQRRAKSHLTAGFDGLPAASAPLV